MKNSIEIQNPTIVWFRHDLRIEDQPALSTGIKRGNPIIPLFIWAPEEEGEWAPGGASKWWLHGSLISLQNELHKLGLNLILRFNHSLETLIDIIQQTKANTVYWNRCYEPHIVKRDAKIKAELNRLGVKVEIFNGGLLYDPWMVLNKQNKSYQVFTPFWKACCEKGEPPLPLPKPKSATPFKGNIESESVESFQLIPKIHWDLGLNAKWVPGTTAALHKLKYALENVISDYKEHRDFPSIQGTSELSPYLSHGDISPRMIWHYVKQKYSDQNQAQPFLRQLGWREFAYYLLYHFPHTPNEPLHENFNAFPWEKNENDLKAWQKGVTGYPIVDAGMRQLWQTGWMHNRVRMIVGSFLVKDLRIHWIEGARWFWDTLVDADLANNTLGWQWVGGCGADAAPYFRIFNPITQGEKFDSEGIYIRQWIPEIRLLPNKWIHRPWEAPQEVLREVNVILGRTYPKPIVDHVIARKKALDAFEQVKINS